jgi:glucosamine-6-phosphate deaminase
MQIIVADDYSELSERAAGIVATVVKEKDGAVLGLATGSTPEGMYARLIQLYREGEVDFSKTVTFNLDEYAGLPPEHEQSYHYFMHRHFFDHVNISPESINIPQCPDPENPGQCSNYDRRVKVAGGINLQVLGIGINGHIGFNEPGQYLQAQTHLAELSEETIEANSRFFKSPREVPRKAVTMGMGSIMHADKILLLACGSSKAKAIKTMCSGKITTGLPASLLQLHRNVIVLVDREAAALIEES